LDRSVWHVPFFFSSFPFSSSTSLKSFLPFVCSFRKAHFVLPFPPPFFFQKTNVQMCVVFLFSPSPQHQRVGVFAISPPPFFPAPESRVVCFSFFFFFPPPSIVMVTLRCSFAMTSRFFFFPFFPAAHFFFFPYRENEHFFFTLFPLYQCAVPTRQK